MTAEPAGENCTYGGEKLTVGTDTSYVCNGAPGTSVTVTTEPPGANCAHGGVEIQIGTDPPDYVCNGSSLTWTTITASAQAQGDFGYVSNAVAPITLTLPVSASLSVGDELELLLHGAGDVSVTPNAGQWFQCGGGLVPVETVWHRTSAPRRKPPSSWQSVASSSDGTQLVAVGLGTIYTSPNSGATWSVTSAPNADWYSVASSSDGSHLVAVTGGGIYTSADSGGTWIARTSAPSATGPPWPRPPMGRTWWPSSLAVGSTRRRTRARPGSGRLRAERNLELRGVVFRRDPPGGRRRRWRHLHVSRRGHDLDPTSLRTQRDLVLRGLFRRWDPRRRGRLRRRHLHVGGLGRDWVARTSAPNAIWSSVASSSDGTHLVAVGISETGIYASTDSGVTWTATFAPASDWSSVASSSDGANLVATSMARASIQPAPARSSRTRPPRSTSSTSAATRSSWQLSTVASTRPDEIWVIAGGACSVTDATNARDVVRSPCTRACTACRRGRAIAGQHPEQAEVHVVVADDCSSRRRRGRCD